MTLYRKGELNLSQLSAFAITEDHKRQEQVWEALPPFNCGREAILHALSEGQVRSSDRRALLVGTKAYEAAGGSITRDLFDPEGGGFFTDAALLDRLAREKLLASAEEVAKEGWRWVLAEIEFDREAAAGMRRVFAKPVKLSAKQRKKLHQLETRHDAICDRYPDGALPDGVAAKLARIEGAVEALRRQDLALAGAFIMLAHDGAIRV
jgi:ParB family transcriptional regulator, chromosome partitioning protein